MRTPWVAVVLSLLCPGLGHLYCGRWVRGLLLLLFPFLVCAGFAWLATWPSASVVPFLLVGGVLLCPVIYLFAVLDAYRLAKAAPADFERRWWQNPLVYALAIVVSFLSVPLTTLFLRAEVIEAFVVPAGSMVPAIEPGDRVLVTKWGWEGDDARRGDILVFRVWDEGRHLNYVKRVAGLPGEEVRLSSGEASEVPDGHLWMLGDNRDRSRDSRHFGSVPMRDVVGRARYRFWPPTRFGRLE